MPGVLTVLGLLLVLAGLVSFAYDAFSKDPSRHMRRVPDPRVPADPYRARDSRLCYQDGQDLKDAINQIRKGADRLITLLGNFRKTKYRHKMEILASEAHKVKTQVQAIIDPLMEEFRIIEQAAGYKRDSPPAPPVVRGARETHPTWGDYGATPTPRAGIPQAGADAASRAKEAGGPERQAGMFRPVIPGDARGDQWASWEQGSPLMPEVPAVQADRIEDVVSIWNNSGTARFLDIEALSSRLGPGWQVRRIYDDQTPTALFLFEDRNGPVGRRLFVLPGIGEWFAGQVSALFRCTEADRSDSDLVVDRVDEPVFFRDESRLSFETLESRHLLAADAVVQGKVRTRPG